MTSEQDISVNIQRSSLGVCSHESRDVAFYLKITVLTPLASSGFSPSFPRCSLSLIYVVSSFRKESQKRLTKESTERNKVEAKID